MNNFIHDKSGTLILSILLFLLPSILFGQSYNRQANFLKANNVWVFGDDAGLDFSSGVPESLPTTIGGPEGRASVADPISGRLLFYTNGNKAYNKNQRQMPNGGGLYGNINVSSVQGACIVPVINNPGKYYIFSLLGITNIGSPFSYPSPAGSLYYSVVNMDLEGGLGDVEMSRKNILLDTSLVLSEAMIAIPGDNCDIWLIVHEYGKPVFKAYHITENGVDPNPVISKTGEQINTQLPANQIQPYGVGSMFVSPNRSRIVISSYYSSLSSPAFLDKAAGVLICKFDPGTGIVSDAIEIEKNILTYGPGAFSPNGNLLYLPSFDWQNRIESLNQYDISNFDSVAIATSKKVVEPNLTTNYTKTTLRLFGDSIYVGVSGNTSLGIITKPNVLGVGSNYQPSVIPLYSNSKCGMGFPTEVVYPMQGDSVYRTVLDTFICTNIESGLQLQPRIINKGYAYLWSTGVSDSMFTISDSGTYWVQYANGCHFYVDSFKVQTANIQAIITIDTFDLSTTKPYVSYQWLFNGASIPGATNRIYTASKNGNYTVIVRDENGCVDTSDIYKVTNVTSIPLRNKLAEAIRIYPNPIRELVHISTPIEVNLTITTIEGHVIKKEEKAREMNLSNLQTGIYFMHISDQNNTLIKVEKIIKM